MPKRKGGKTQARKGKKAKTGEEHSDDDGSDSDTAAAAVANSINSQLREIRARKEAQEAGEDSDDSAEEAEEEKGEKAAVDKVEGEEEAEKEPEKPDPYLMADADYIKKDTRWRNKQRTLVFASRGVTSRFRHLCEDIRKLLPHHKTEPKFDKKMNLQEINEVCELKSCNNVVFFEARKKEDLYMYVGRVPNGPTIKFQVKNIHTSAEIRLAGNCLLGSRPILYFDKAFSEKPHLRLTKTLFTQVFGTPRNHPKSKPFHDHIMGFYFVDGMIWFRHYQIAGETPDAGEDPEKQQLTEIGPRFVMDPIRIFSGSFCGQTLFQNAGYMSPTALRVHAKKMLKSPYVKKKQDEEKRTERKIAGILPEDPTDEAFV